MNFALQTGTNRVQTIVPGFLTKSQSGVPRTWTLAIEQELLQEIVTENVNESFANNKCRKIIL
jgi:hypothetical protein